MRITGNFGDLIDPAIRKIFDDVYAAFPEEFSQVFTVGTSDRHYEKFSSSTGFGMASDVDEGEEIPAGDPAQGFDLTFTHKKIGQAFLVSRELLADDLFKVIAAKPASLARALHRKIEDDCRVVFDSAGVTTYNTGADGKALAATDHPREDGGTAQSNKSTTALAEASYEAAIIAMSRIKDGKGQRINLVPSLLVVPKDLQTTARILMESTGRTGTANNDVNPLKGLTDIFVYNHLTDTNNWFLLDRSYTNGLNFFWREKTALERDDNVSNQVARWFATARYSYGWIDWRSIYCGVVA